MALHYYNPEELAAAGKVRAQVRRNPRPPALPPPASTIATSTPNASVIIASTIQSILSDPDLTPDAKNAAVMALTANAR